MTGQGAATEVVPYKPQKARDLKKLPVRSISELQWILSEGLYVQLYSADGRRSVDVQCAPLLEAVNDCVVLAEACKMDLVVLGSVLDEVESARRDGSTYAKAYVAQRIQDPYWLQKAQHIVSLAPDGSGTREALRYLLATLKLRDVLY